MFENVGVNITCHTLQDNVRTNEFVTSDTTPHVYEKTMLVVAFSSSLRIITIPYLGVYCIVDSIADKMSRYTSTAPNLATVANRAHVYVYEYSMTFLTRN
jgi:hypothetical protein